MLVLAGTIELRENMAIFPIHTPKRHFCLIRFVAGLLSVLLPAQGLAVDLSSPVGVQEIGKQLNLKSTLSGIPEGADSQLRSTCLKARILSTRSGSDGTTLDGLSDVLVNFQPTIAQGGVLELKSRASVNEAVVDLELVSECPLVVFRHQWTLIMSAASAKAREIEHAGVPTTQSGRFDFGNSALLQASRRAPKVKPEYSLPALPTVKESKQKQDAVEELEQIEQPEAAEKLAPENSEPEPVRIASLDPEILAPGLIESRRTSGHDMNGSLGIGEMAFGNEVPSDGLFGGLLKSTTSWIFVLSFTLLMLLVLVFVGQKWLGRANLRSALPGQGGLDDLHAEKVNEFHAFAGSQDQGFSRDQGAYGTDRVLESLIGGDEPGYEEIQDAASHLIHHDALDSNNRSSLKISLELINRADIRGWSLPAPYQHLVEQRNKSLELHRTPGALLLRCHIGLVELAFQDAKQNQSTKAQTALDFLGLVLGEHVYDVDSNPTLCVPDVVKSHVRAKMCEITGAEKRQLLRENLVNLNVQVLSPALCFHTDAWREFLSEEGSLD